MKKNGISIITLIITIIVIIILSSTIIFSLNNTHIINNANTSVDEKDRSNLIDAYNLIIMDGLVDENVNNGNRLNITLSDLANKIGRNEIDLQDRFKIDELGNLLEKQGNNWVVIVYYPSLKKPEDKLDYSNIKDMIATDVNDITKIQVGDFINYDAGIWNESDINRIVFGKHTGKYTEELPKLEYQFGGFKLGDSRNNNALIDNLTYVGLENIEGKVVSGWRVFDMDKETGVITLVSAGCPENYYTYVNNFKESENLLINRDYSMYVNSKSTRASILTKNELDKWFNKYMKVENADVFDDNVFQKIYNTKYETLIDKYLHYWFATSNSNGMCYINPHYRFIRNNFDYSFGISILVYLKNDIKIENKAINKVTIKNPRGTNNNFTYNVWNILK